jgi:F0F1-type ATP synthase assembly protein I
MGAAYQGAFEAVFAILIAVLAGHWADEALGTGPWLVLLGIAVGFGSFVLRLIRLGKRLEALAKEGAEGGDGAEL